MKVTLFMPYEDYGNLTFDAGKEISDSEYTKMMEADYNLNSDIIHNSMRSTLDDGTSLIGSTDGQIYHFGQKTQETANKVAYSPCECDVTNDEGVDNIVDYLIEHFVSGKPFLLAITPDIITADVDFETELAAWANEHNRILNYYESMRRSQANGTINEVWRIAHEPKRNLRMMFVNNADETLHAALDNVMILEILDDTLIVKVEKFRLIDNF